MNVNQKSLETVFLIANLPPLGRQMAIENSVSNNFLSKFVDSINVFDCLLYGVIMH